MSRRFAPLRLFVLSANARALVAQASTCVLRFLVVLSLSLGAPSSFFEGGSWVFFSSLRTLRSLCRIWPFAERVGLNSNSVKCSVCANWSREPFVRPFTYEEK